MMSYAKLPLMVWSTVNSLPLNSPFKTFNLITCVLKSKSVETSEPSGLESETISTTLAFADVNSTVSSNDPSVGANGSPKFTSAKQRLGTKRNRTIKKAKNLFILKPPICE